MFIDLDERKDQEDKPGVMTFAVVDPESLQWLHCKYIVQNIPRHSWLTISIY